MVGTVRQVQAKTGVSASTIRWYLRKGLLSPRRRDGNGYHDFGPADLRILGFIRRARSLGFTLADIKEVLARARQHESPCLLVRQIAEKRRAEIAASLQSLRTMDRRLRSALRAWKDMPDRAPRGDRICGLLEAVPSVPQSDDRIGFRRAAMTQPARRTRMAR